MARDRSPASALNDDAEDVDDRFRALMEGLRTTLPGVQVLFAFLLTLPLQGGFSELTNLERSAYYIALFGAAIASILLIAPSAHQRVRAPMTGVKRHHVSHLRFTATLTIVGTAVFLVALGASIYLVSTLVFNEAWLALLPTAAAVLLAGWAWFWVPMVSWRADRADVTRPSGGAGRS